MRFYKHIITKTDLFLLRGDAPQWIDTHVDGSYSPEDRTPMYYRLNFSGEIVLVHIEKWLYNTFLVEISEQEARALDATLVDRIAALDPGGQQIPPLSKKTRIYGVLQEQVQPPAPGGGG